MRRCTEADSFLWLSAGISRGLKYVIYAFAAVNYRYIIHFLMKWVGLWKFHIRYQPCHRFLRLATMRRLLIFCIGSSTNY